MRIQSVVVTECTPAWSWQSAGHADYDLWTVLRGRGELSAGSVRRTVTAGSSVLIPPRTPLTGTHDPLHPLSVIAVHFQPDEAMPAIFDEKPFCVRAVTDLALFRTLLQRTVRLYISDKKEDALIFFRAVLAEFFSLGNEPNASLHSREIGEICDRIDRGEAPAPPLSALAAEYGYSADYLGRLFRQTTGVTYSAYTAGVRVNKAKELLAATPLSCGEIAEKLGYCDTAHFSRQFARVAGLPPGEFRKKQ